MKKYQVNVYEEPLLNFLDTKSNVSEFIRTILDDFRTGKISYDTNSELTTKQKLEKVKLANETLKIWKEFNHAGFNLDQLEKFVNDGEMPFMENPVFPKEEKKNENPKLTFGKTITYTSSKIKQKDGTLRCKRCNRIFEMKAFDFQQLDKFRNHVENNHGKLNQEERDELMELYN